MQRYVNERIFDVDFSTIRENFQELKSENNDKRKIELLELFVGDLMVILDEQSQEIDKLIETLNRHESGLG